MEAMILRIGHYAISSTDFAAFAGVNDIRNFVASPVSLRHVRRTALGINAYLFGASDYDNWTTGTTRS